MCETTPIILFFSPPQIRTKASTVRTSVASLATLTAAGCLASPCQHVPSPPSTPAM